MTAAISANPSPGAASNTAVVSDCSIIPNEQESKRGTAENTGRTSRELGSIDRLRQ